MDWRRVVALILLIFILVELCDPTTPFIRISGKPQTIRKQAVLTTETSSAHERLCESSPSGTERKAAALALENADHTGVQNLEKRGFATPDYHDAVESLSLAVPKPALAAIYTLSCTGLKNQYDPDCLIRPPIAPVA